MDSNCGASQYNTLTQILNTLTQILNTLTQTFSRLASLVALSGPPPNAPPSPPRFPSEKPKPRDNNYGELLRSQIEQDSMAKASSASRFAPAAASPPRFPSEKAASASRGTNDYGDLLRSQMAQDSIAKASHNHDALQADYEAKKQEVRMDSNFAASQYNKLTQPCLHSLRSPRLAQSPAQRHCNPAGPPTEAGGGPGQGHGGGENGRK